MPATAVSVSKRESTSLPPWKVAVSVIREAFPSQKPKSPRPAVWYPGTRKSLVWKPNWTMP